MEVILKSKNGVHVHLDANDSRGLLNLKYLCSLLDVPYEGVGNDSNLLIVFYVQIMPDDFVMQLHRF